jgi:mannan endo-1,4-beta-mannosidase
MKSPLLLAALALVLATAPLRADPVNPDASPEAKRLLEFLVGIQGRYILTGQHNFDTAGSTYTNIVQAITGKSPIVWGSDFSFAYQGSEPQKFQHCGPINLTHSGEPLYYVDVTPAVARQRMVETAIREYKAGHIITLMWHAPPPGHGDTCDGKLIWAMADRPGPKEWRELTTDGTPMNLAWKQQADVIAGYLAQLRDARVPVLWRPYHEMNGVWFWWCDQKGDEGFRRLWIMMYEYFVNRHHLNNLIWVWDTNAPRSNPGDEAFAYADFWPGSQYVDVLAADIYHKKADQGADEDTNYRDLVKLADGKPVAMGEVGEPPSPELLNRQPKWVWFMPWPPFGALARDNPAKLRLLYADPRALAQGDVSIAADGTYQILRR